MHRWKLSALAAAALVSVSLTATDAWALALGRISIQSALGEPLRAEVDLPQITAAEADSLRATIATPAVFRAQGMEYTATASQFQVQLQRRPDGSAVLRLSSAQPVAEPFVDLVIDASWAAGHVVRSYTLLLDPPAGRQPAPAATSPAQIGAPAPQATAPARSASARTAPPAGAATRNAPAEAPKSSTLTVRPGDTASRLAQANRPAGVSLDQMLVAMLRANPHAFISGNVNRMTAGAVVEMPDEAAAQATSAREARQIVAAQSQDFNQYRRRLAGAAPVAAVTAAQRSASGNVEAQVQDKKPSTTAPDKLTLSKGALQGSQNADERLAREKQAQSQSERLSELSRNLNELQKVAAGAAAPGTPVAGTPAAGVALPGVPATGIPAAGIPAPGVPAEGAAAPGIPAADTAAGTAADTTAPATAEGATPAAETAPPTASADAPAAAEATPAAPAPAAPAAAAPAEAAPETPGFLDTLSEDPALPLAGAGLLALLLGYAGYRRVQKRRQQDAAGDSLLHPDSVFAAGQGQQVDTAHTQFGSSTAYSHSQLDTGGEVDPVAEADVYLAYGRDLQAEEILKEALRSQPERLALHQKLADIYAKRHDRKAFEAVAQTVFVLTEGRGAEWQHLAEQGRALDPTHSLYQSSTDADARPGDAAAQTQADDRSLAQASVAAALGGLAASSSKTEPSVLPGLDMSLDLDLPSGLADPLPPAAVPSAAQPQSPDDIDFEPIEPIWKQPAAATQAPAPEPDLPETAFDALADLPPVTPAAQPASDALPDLEWGLDQAAATPAADVPAEMVEPSAAQPEFTLTDTPAAVAADLAPPDAPGFDTPVFELEDTDKTGATPAEVPAAAAPAAAPAFDFLEFDLGNLSLDLGPAAPVDALSQSSQAAAEDPLATKLALAQEFAAIGDSDGARTLIEEVIEVSEGELKERAQRLLAEIN
jgi:pilus assembly protein FimV